MTPDDPRHPRSVADVLAALGTAPRGLSAQEAAALLPGLSAFDHGPGQHADAQFFLGIAMGAQGTPVARDASDAAAVGDPPGGPVVGFQAAGGVTGMGARRPGGAQEGRDRAWSAGGTSCGRAPWRAPRCSRRSDARAGRGAFAWG